jgi:hypothetical protein
VYPDVVAAVIATLGYLINFFDRANSVTTLEFNLIEAVLDTFWRLRFPTISRDSVGSVVPIPTFPLTVKLLETTVFPLTLNSPPTSAFEDTVNPVVGFVNCTVLVVAASPTFVTCWKFDVVLIDTLLIVSVFVVRPPMRVKSLFMIMSATFAVPRISSACSGTSVPTPTLESAIITLALGVALVKSKNPEVGPMGIF